MTWVRVAVLELKVVLGWKVALIGCDPTARVVVEKVATPLALTVCCPRTVVPSLKTTMPEGAPEGVVTVAVKVTFVPVTTGEPEVVIAVVVEAGGGSGVMTWVRVAVLELKVVLGWKVALMGCDPTARVVVEKVATPLALTVCCPRTVVPSLKTTVPEGVPEGVLTVAVKVTFVPVTTGEPVVVIAVVVAAGGESGVMVRVPGVLVME
jgi:hypothetical protein